MSADSRSAGGDGDVSRTGGEDDDRPLSETGNRPLSETDVDGVDTGAIEMPDPDESDSAAPARRGVGGVLRKHRIAVVLVAVLVGGAAAAGAIFATGGFDDRGAVGEAVGGDPMVKAADAFTDSAAGDCLNWAAAAAGKPEAVDCAQPHRFEVASVVDTEVLPGAEFGDQAPWPGPVRFTELRDEMCAVSVTRYLAASGSGLDPQGRFAVGLMYPSKIQWEDGWRELRCGIEEPGDGKAKGEFSGRVADVDQSFAWEPGTCIGIDRATRQPTRNVVDCAEPHAFQTTAVVDLAPRFGDRKSGKPWPNETTQDSYLRTICPSRTNQFFGGQKKFDATTLYVQSSTLGEPGWLVGSRRAVCFVGLADRGGFATLVGDARQSLLINGKVPTLPAQAPPGRALPSEVPVAPGYQPNPTEVPASGGGG